MEKKKKVFPIVAKLAKAGLIDNCQTACASCANAVWYAHYGSQRCYCAALHCLTSAGGRTYIGETCKEYMDADRLVDLPKAVCHEEQDECPTEPDKELDDLVEHLKKNDD